jgi:hypothetical protein
MILRRVIAHFRKQEWTAIAIDFVIVVVGVFIGLQVSNANDLRKDHAREKVFLAALAQDIRGDIDEIDEIIRVSTLRLSAMQYLVETASGAPLPRVLASARGDITLEAAPAYDPDDAKTIGVAMFILTTLDGNRLAYETMINTGGIGVVRDDALLRRIQTYYADVDKALTFEQSLEVNRTRLVDAEQAAGLSPVDAMPAAEIVARFADDPALLAAARNYGLYTNRHVKIMRELRMEAASLAATLERMR